MTGLIRGHWTLWPQQEGAEEPESNWSVPKHEEQPDAAAGKVIADYNLGINYEPEG